MSHTDTRAQQPALTPVRPALHCPTLPCPALPRPALLQVLLRHCCCAVVRAWPSRHLVGALGGAGLAYARRHPHVQEGGHRQRVECDRVAHDRPRDCSLSWSLRGTQACLVRDVDHRDPIVLAPSMLFYH
jgi:hypothetical protein